MPKEDRKHAVDLVKRLAAALPDPGGRVEFRWAWEVLSDETREDLRQLKVEAAEFTKVARG